MQLVSVPECMFTIFPSSDECVCGVAPKSSNESIASMIDVLCDSHHFAAVGGIRGCHRSISAGEEGPAEHEKDTTPRTFFWVFGHRVCQL